MTPFSTFSCGSMFINIFKHGEACNSIPGQPFSHTWEFANIATAKRDASDQVWALLFSPRDMRLGKFAHAIEIEAKVIIMSFYPQFHMG